MAETAASSALFKLAKTALSAQLPETAGGGASGSRNNHDKLSRPPLFRSASDDRRRVVCFDEVSMGNNNNGVVSSPAARTSTQLQAQQATANGGCAARNGYDEWRRFLSVEERQGVREKIRTAYRNTCKSYDELLATVTAIEEEFLHIAAPSRLDYFKSGCHFEQRVHEKRKQFSTAAAAAAAAAAVTPPSEDENDPRPAKRAKAPSRPEVSSDGITTAATAAPRLPPECPNE